MKPLQSLDFMITPEGRKLELQQRDRDFFILLDGEELMSTRAVGSEVALAEIGCRDVPKQAPRVLIGGLGCGFTLKACLDLLPADAEVVVAELFPAVLEWNRTHFAPFHGHAVDDPRARIQIQDVWDVIGTPGPGFDAILLDVDNGPNAWVLESNGRLYDRDGIEHLRRAMNPGARVAVWSAQPDPQFANRLRKRGFEVRTQMARSQEKTDGRRHVVISAQASPKSRLRKAPVAQRRLKKKR